MQLSFLNPSLLIGLIAIAIPIILHFLYRKRIIEIDFSTIFFLKKLQKNKMNQVTWLEWLILLLRILTISAIVIAFSNPVSKHNLPLSEATKLSHFISIDQSIINQASYQEKSLINYLNEEINLMKETIASDDDLYIINPYNYDISKIEVKNLSANVAGYEMNNRYKIEPSKVVNEVQSFIDEQSITNYRIHIYTADLFVDSLANTKFYSYYPEDIKLYNNRIKRAELVQQSMTSFTPLTIRAEIELDSKDKTHILTTIVNSETKNERVIEKSGTFIIPIGKYDEGQYDVEVKLSAKDDYLYDNSYFLTFNRSKIKKVLLLTNQANSSLIHLFKNLPDSNISIDIAKTAEALSYPLQSYQSIFWEGNVPDLTTQRNLETVIEKKTTNFIFIPVENFDYSMWNQSLLKKYIQFTAINGQIESKTAKSQFNSAHISESLLPELSNFKERNNDFFHVNYNFEVNPRNLIRLMGTRQNRLLVKNKDYKTYFFLFPFNREATDFIYDSRFVPLVYQMIFIESNQIRVQDFDLYFTGYISNPSLIITGPEKYSLAKMNSDLLSSKFRLPSDIKTGNFRFEANNKDFRFSYNDHIMDAFNFAHYEKSDTRFLSGQSELKHNWRFFILLALILYILELLIGRGKII